MEPDAFKKLTLNEKFTVVIATLVVVNLVFALLYFVFKFYVTTDMLAAPCNRCLAMNPDMIKAIQQCQVHVSGLNLSALGGV